MVYSLHYQLLSLTPLAWAGSVRSPGNVLTPNAWKAGFTAVAVINACALRKPLYLSDLHAKHSQML